MKKIEYSTYYVTWKKINVLYYLITAHFLNYSTWCFVRNYLLGFTTTYLIIAHKYSGYGQTLKKGKKELKRGIYPICAVLIVLY